MYIMKQLVTSLCLLLLLIPQLPAETNQNQKTVTIIPIKGMIEPALLYVVRRGYDDAVRNQADAIIFHMDTPGGAVNAAGEIISLIGKNDTQHPTLNKEPTQLVRLSPLLPVTSIWRPVV